MPRNEHHLPCWAIGDGISPSPADNENLPLLDNCPLTPAEVIQWARREKKRLRRKLAADPGLWNCPKYRKDWEVTVGIEKVTLRQCFGVHDVP